MIFDSTQPGEINQVVAMVAMIIERDLKDLPVG